MHLTTSNIAVYLLKQLTRNLIGFLSLIEKYFSLCVPFYFTTFCLLDCPFLFLLSANYLKTLKNFFFHQVPLTLGTKLSNGCFMA